MYMHKKNKEKSMIPIDVWLYEDDMETFSRIPIATRSKIQ